MHAASQSTHDQPALCHTNKPAKPRGSTAQKSTRSSGGKKVSATTKRANGDTDSNQAIAAAARAAKSASKKTQALALQKREVKELADAKVLAISRKAEAAAVHEHTRLLLPLMKDHLVFLILDVGASPADVAGIFDFNDNTLTSMRNRAEESRARERRRVATSRGGDTHQLRPDPRGAQTPIHKLLRGPHVPHRWGA